MSTQTAPPPLTAAPPRGARHHSLIGGRIRRLLLQIHLYGGLACSAYLLVFAISSLDFNHEFSSLYNHDTTTTFTQQIAPPAATGDAKAAAEAARQELDLPGWTLAWKTWRPKEGGLHTEVARPACNYTIDVDAAGLATVKRTNHGVSGALRGMHGIRGTPGSTMMSVWGVYTDVTTFTVLFLVLSGIYLWTRRRAERVLGLVTLSICLLGSLAFMLWIEFIG